MAGEATQIREASEERQTLLASAGLGEVQQLPSGSSGWFFSKAGQFGGQIAGSSGDTGDFRKAGTVTLPKDTAFQALRGGRAYWDHSANKVTFRKVNDRDFYLGRFEQDAGLSDSTCLVCVGVDSSYDLDIARDPIVTTPVGTQGLNTMGVFRHGGANRFLISSTSEAQKLDILSIDGFSTEANAVIEFAFRVVADGASTAVDVSLGVASGTNATDADSIASSIFIHLDENDTKLYAESDDNASGEVSATDTSTTYTEGSAVANRVECWIDMRNPASVAFYVNGVRVLSGTTFDVSVVATTWFLLAHIEKTSSSDTYELVLDWMRARYVEN